MEYVAKRLLTFFINACIGTAVGMLVTLAVTYRFNCAELLMALKWFAILMGALGLILLIFYYLRKLIVTRRLASREQS